MSDLPDTATLDALMMQLGELRTQAEYLEAFLSLVGSGIGYSDELQQKGQNILDSLEPEVEATRGIKLPESLAPLQHKLDEALGDAELVLWR